MGFTDLLSDAGLAVLDSWLATRSYIVGHSPSQADVTVFKALQSAPASTKYPHAARWYTHLASFDADFATLPGDAAKPYTVYGPEGTEKEAVDVGLFGSDEEQDEEAAKIREQRLEEYRKKKKDAKGPKPAAKSVVTLDVKPWDDETDLAAMEAAVRGIGKDGLVWGASKFVAVGFGIKKLHIMLVVEDEKVSTDELEEEIRGFEDYVQSADVVTMQKL